MLSRHELFKGCLTLENRRVLFKKLAGYWENLILKNNISTLIIEEEPHIFSDYVAYIVAKALSIKVIFFSRIADGNKLLVFDSIEQNAEPLQLLMNDKNQKLLIRKQLEKTWSIYKGQYAESENYIYMIKL